MAISRSSMFVRGAFRKLPVEATVIAVIAIAAITALHAPYELWPFRIALTGVLVGPLAVAAHRLGRRRQAAVAAVLGAGILAALTAASPSFAATQAASFTWPFALAFTAALLAPFVTAPDGTRFVRRFFEETTTWALLAICGFAAFGAIVVALDELFDLRFHRLDQDAAVVLGAAIVLLYVDRLLADDTAGRVPVLWRRLATAIGAPFVSVMLVILVAYEVVALVRGELPRNMLSPLILAAGLVGFVTTSILTAVLDGEVGTAALAPADPHRWTRRPIIRLARAFPVVLLALLPMAGWALWIRICDHGVTPFRAVRGAGLACLAVLGVASAIRWWRGRPPLTWQVPAAFAGFALAIGFGPLGAVEQSIRSQAAVLDAMLARDHLPRVALGESFGLTLASLPEDRYDALERQIVEVGRLGGVAALRRVLAGDVEPCAHTWSARLCLDALGITRADRETPRVRVFELPVRGRFPIAAGALERVDASWGEAGARRVPLEDDRVLEVIGDAVAIVDGNAVAVARGSLAAVVHDGVAAHGLSATPVRLLGPDGEVVGELCVFYLTVASHVTGPEILALRGVVIWRR